MSGGDSELRELLLGSAPLISRAVRPVLRQQADKEDVMQQALMKVADGFRTVRGPEAYPAWLWRVATNCAIDANRRSRPHLSGVDMDTLPDPKVAAPFFRAVLNEEVDALKDRIRRLPRAYHQVVALAALDGLTPAEIARSLGLTEDAVRSRLRRGQAMLDRRGES